MSGCCIPPRPCPNLQRGLNVPDTNMVLCNTPGYAKTMAQVKERLEGIKEWAVEDYGSAAQ